MDTRVCIRCPEKGPQPVSAFHKRGNSYSSWCKACKKAHHQTYYQNTKDDQNHKRNLRRREVIEWIRDHKKGCSRCPETHPACLQFHHRDPAEKEFNIGEAIRLGWSVERIEAEIAKCDVLCANCHAKEHWPVTPEGFEPSFSA